MNSGKTMLVVPLLLITVGTGWLLTTLGVAPDIDWIWTLGLVVIGVTVLTRGIDKVTVVVGPFFLVSSFLSLLRQTGRLEVDVEVPILVISAGLLMLVARINAVPVPDWFIPQQNENG